MLRSVVRQAGDMGVQVRVAFFVQWLHGVEADLLLLTFYGVVRQGWVCLIVGRMLLEGDDWCVMFTICKVRIPFFIYL